MCSVILLWQMYLQNDKIEKCVSSYGLSVIERWQKSKIMNVMIICAFLALLLMAQ